MRKGTRKKLLALMLAAAMTVPQAGQAFAAEAEGSAAEDGIELVSETDAISETSAQMPEASQEYPMEAVTEAAGEASAAGLYDAGAAALSSELAGIASADYSVSLPYGLKGLPEGGLVDAAQMHAKEEIQSHGVVSDMAFLKSGVDYAENEVIYPADNEEEARQIAEAYNAKLVSFSFGIAVAELDPDKITVAQAVALGSNLTCRSLPPVEANFYRHTFEEPEGNSSIQAVPADGGGWKSWTGTYNDPALKTDYMLDGKRAYQWVHEAVGTYAAWSVNRGAGITVAVLDSSVQADHEDLLGKVTTPSWNIMANEAKDYTGHGTHVAGIIAASANNAKGGVGIAPEAQILNVPVFEGLRADDADIIRGINAVAGSGPKDRKADIINMSLGSPFYSLAFEEAVKKACETSEIVICCSLGNDGSNTKNYPAAYEEYVIGVSSSDSTGSLSSFSDYGTWADITAPGSDILSTWNGNDCEKDTDYPAKAPGQKDRYDVKNGTSMASPVAAGVIALYMNAYKEKNGYIPTPAQVKDALKNKKYVTKLNGTGGGTGIISASALLASFEDLKNSKPVVKLSSTVSSDTLTSLSDNSAIYFEPEKKYTGAIGYAYTLDGSKPAYSEGAVTKGYFAEAGRTVTVKDLLSQGAVPGEDTTIKAIRINAQGKVSGMSTTTIRIGSAVKNPARLSGPGQVVKGKSFALKTKTAPFKVLPASYKPSQITWSIEGNPNGVSIAGNGGKLKVTKAASGTFALVASLNGAELCRRTLEVIDAPTSLRLNVKELTQEGSKVYNVKKKTNGSVTSVRLYNVDIPGNAISENKITVEPMVVGKTTSFTYKSSSPKVAEVDPDTGLVTAHRKGTATITCKLSDGSGKTASFKVQVIIPASDLKLIQKDGQDYIGFGYSATLKPVLNSAYGKPGVTAVNWNETTDVGIVEVRGFDQQTGPDGADVTSTIKSNKYITVKNGVVKVDAKIKKLPYFYYIVVVRAKTKDGTEIFQDVEYMVINPVKYLKYDKDESGYFNDDTNKYRGIQNNTVKYGAMDYIAGYIYIKADVGGPEPLVKSSNPKLATIKFLDNGVGENTSGVYRYLFVTGKGKPTGKVKFTFTANDRNAGKKAVNLTLNITQ